jgi:tetratricopeptide (TPR) repeat protein
LEKELSIERPESERRLLVEQRAGHLQAAIEQYGRAIAAFERIREHQRTPPEREAIKYARLWRADAAFELELYPRAIEMYADVVDRYAGEPACLVALIQIVNSYAAMGDYQAARTAQNRARTLLKELPDEVFDEGLLDMDREAWARWLDWDHVLTAEAAAPESDDAP